MAKQNLEDVNGITDPAFITIPYIDKMAVEQTKADKLYRQLRTKYLRYQRFVREANTKRVDPNNIFQDVERKRELLGYSKLKVRGKGARSSTRECTDEIIGNAFKNNYNNAVKFLEKHRALFD